MPIVRKIAPPERDEPEGPPPGFPPLTLDHLRAWLGEATLRRGEPYVVERIFDTRSTGRTLKAGCQGSASQPYRVEATIGARGGVASDDCTCPVGHQCKNVAALLLAWLEDPGGFVEVEDLEASLARRDKVELIALIRQMLARRPELESLLELPLPIAGQHRKSADAALIRREVATAFRDAGHEWGAASVAARNLEPLVKLGDDYASLDDTRSAAAVYQAITLGVTEHYNEVHDEEGALNVIVNDCVSGLGECLHAVGDPAQRESLLRALFEIYRWDLESGGRDIGYEGSEMIVEQATPAEREMVAHWVHEAMPADDSWNHRWRRQAFGGFLLRLAGDELDDETYLSICHESGRRRNLIEKLLALARVDEAEAETRLAEDSELLILADLLYEQGHAERAEHLVREHQPAPQWQDRYDEWRCERACERGDIAAAQALSEELFWRHPSLPRYERLQALAEMLRSWDALRPEVLRRLERERQYVLLTQIHLHAGEVAAALDAVRQAGVAGSFPYAYGSEPLAVRVALAAEPDFPREAIALYTAAAERLIQGQGRDNYATAARYLARARDLYRRLGEGAAWDALIGSIREHNRRLRALKEELDRVGL
jgi:uncharacterized Zn finger protein